MTTVKINFNSPNKNVDPSTLSTQLYYMRDSYRDESMALNKRPGLGTACVLDLAVDSPIDGHYWWDKKGVSIVVSNGRVWSYNSAYTATELTNGTSLLSQREKCTFTEVKETSSNKVWLFIANGVQILKTDGTAAAASLIATTDSPVNSTHIAHIDGYLITNDIETEAKKNTWQIAAVNDPTNFAGGEDYTAPMQVDDIVALIEARRLLYVFGRQTIEPWYNTGGATASFERVNGGLLNIGLFSANSVTKYKTDIYFLSNNREIVLLKEYNPIVISYPYNKYIQALETINDVIIEVVSSFDGYDFLLCHFPSEDITLSHNITLYNRTNGEVNDWYEWSYWSNNTNNQFLGIHSIYASGWGVYLIGDRTDSKIYTFKQDNLNDAGSAIKTEIVTGHIDHGTFKRKKSHWLILKFKRGETVLNKTVYVYWRDNGDSEWTNAVSAELDSGSLGDRELFIKLLPMGIYRTRQYKIVCGDEINLILSGLEEEVDLLNE